MIYHDTQSPVGLATKLATYIKDPSTIRARVMDHFGRAPTIDKIRELQAQVNKPKPYSGTADHKFRLDCLKHEGPYEIDEDGFDRCVVCKKEKPQAQHLADMRRRLDDARRKQIERALKEAARQKIAKQQIDHAPVVIVPGFRSVFDQVCDEVCSVFGITREELLGQGRLRYLVDARTVVAVALRRRDPKLWSYPTIGRRLGGRDHSTIISLCENWDIRAQRNPLIGQLLEKLA